MEVAEHGLDFAVSSDCGQSVDYLGKGATELSNQIFLKVTYSVSESIEVTEVIASKDKKKRKNSHVRVSLCLKENIEDTKHTEKQKSYMN